MTLATLQETSVEFIRLKTNSKAKILKQRRTHRSQAKRKKILVYSTDNYK